jgi:hypothetical protein
MEAEAVTRQELIEGSTAGQGGQSINQAARDMSIPIKQ